MHSVLGFFAVKLQGVPSQCAVTSSKESYRISKVRALY